MKFNSVRFWLLVTAALGVFALAYPAIAPQCSGRNCFPVNEYGDWLAGVTQPVAIAWFVAAFWLQRQELALQRQELKETREELKRQADATTSTDLTAKRTLFTTLRPEIYKQLDETLRATKIWLSAEKWWRHEEESLVRSTSINLANALRHTDGNSPPYAFVRSADFLDRSEHYCLTMEALLTLAQEADGESQLFTDLVRSSVYFGYYRQLRLMLNANIGLHPAAFGVRPGDALLNEWNGVKL